MYKDDVDRLIDEFFGIFTNKDLANKDWTVAYRLCLPEVIIVKKNGLDQTIYNLNSFLKKRIEILTNGTLTDFEEYEISEQTILKGNIGLRYSEYEKTGCSNGERFKQSGTKFFQLVKTTDGWKISSLVWEDH